MRPRMCASSSSSCKTSNRAITRHWARRASRLPASGPLAATPCDVPASAPSPAATPRAEPEGCPRKARPEHTSRVASSARRGARRTRRSWPREQLLGTSEISRGNSTARRIAGLLRRRECSPDAGPVPLQAPCRTTGRARPMPRTPCAGGTQAAYSNVYDTGPAGGPTPICTIICTQRHSGRQRGRTAQLSSALRYRSSVSSAITSVPGSPTVRRKVRDAVAVAGPAAAPGEYDRVHSSPEPIRRSSSKLNRTESSTSSASRTVRTASR